MEQLDKKNDVFIDVSEVIKKKNPKLFKFLPKFILNYIKRVIHQDEINFFLKNNHDKYGLDFVKAILDDFKINITVKNEELIPRSGTYIFVANHPLGALESMALIYTVSKYHSKVKFMVNDILMNLKNLNSVFIPVNKHGKSPHEYFRMLDDTFNSGYQVLIFPAGLVSRKIKGKIMDLEWKKSFVSLAKKHDRDIVPVYIDARNSNFFYNLSNIRKFIGIKANIEMLYLADELYKQNNKDIILTFGETIKYSSFGGKMNNSEIANYIKKEVYSLAKEK